MSKKKRVSQSEYARSRKLAQSTISRQIRDGVITTAKDGTIDPDAADKARSDSLNPVRGRRKPAEKSESLAEAVLRKEKAIADLREIEVAQRQGEVVAINDAFEILEDFIGICRNRLLAIPTTAAPELVGETNLAKIQGVLKRYL